MGMKQSLYRRYRPTTFDKVIGQDHIVQTLVNQIKNHTVGHAYLFTGTRGTGKTSIAKIFARAVNCLTPINGSPCGECANCKKMLDGVGYDILELDAASNNGVDQMRELNEKVSYPPTIGDYKVYIIDEAHMLSKSAFNALLKTLEEPPSYMIFILATTEVHSMPQTILSRCQRFDFRLVSTAVLSQHIMRIFDENGVTYEDSAIRTIAAAGMGSVRDALSIADTCLSFSPDKNIKYADVLQVLGVCDPKRIVGLVDAMLGGELDKVLQSVAELADLGKSFSVLAQDISSMLRDVIYVKNCSNAKNLLMLSDEEFEPLVSLANTYGNDALLRALEIISSLEGELRYSSQQRILFESAAVKVSTPTFGTVPSALMKRLEKVETELSQVLEGDFKKKINLANSAVVATQPISPTVQAQPKSQQNGIVTQKSTATAIPDIVSSRTSQSKEIKGNEAQKTVSVKTENEASTEGFPEEPILHGDNDAYTEQSEPDEPEYNLSVSALDKNRDVYIDQASVKLDSFDYSKEIDTEGMTAVEDDGNVFSDDDSDTDSENEQGECAEFLTKCSEQVVSIWTELMIRARKKYQKSLLYFSLFKGYPEPELDGGKVLVVTFDSPAALSYLTLPENESALRALLHEFSDADLKLTKMKPAADNLLFEQHLKELFGSKLTIK